MKKLWSKKLHKFRILSLWFFKSKNCSNKLMGFAINKNKIARTCLVLIRFSKRLVRELTKLRVNTKPLTLTKNPSQFNWNKSTINELKFVNRSQRQREKKMQLRKATISWWLIMRSSENWSRTLCGCKRLNRLSLKERIVMTNTRKSDASVMNKGKRSKKSVLQDKRSGKMKKISVRQRLPSASTYGSNHNLKGLKCTPTLLTLVYARS